MGDNFGSFHYTPLPQDFGKKQETGLIAIKTDESHTKLTVLLVLLVVVFAIINILMLFNIFGFQGFIQSLINPQSV